MPLRAHSFSAASEASASAFIWPLYILIRFAQSAGLIPYRFFLGTGLHRISDKKPRKNRLLVVYAIGGMLLAAYLGSTQVVSEVSSGHFDPNHLEFFSLIYLASVVAGVCMNIAVLVVMFFKSYLILGSVTALHGFVTRTDNRTQFQFRSLVSLLIAVILLLGFYATYVDLTVFLPRGLLAYQGVVPKWLYAAGITLIRLWNLSVTLAPQMVMTGLVGGIGLCFRFLKQQALALETLSVHPEVVLQLQKGQRYFRQLRLALGKINETFSVVNLVAGITEILTFLAFLASQLQPEPVRKLEEDERTYTERVFRCELVRDTLLTMSAELVVVALIRLSTCIFCEEEAETVRHAIENLAAENYDLEVQVECDFFRDLTLEGREVVTAAGYFDLNREYILTVVGFMLTYFILVYQTQDSQNDLQSLRRTMNMLKQQHGQEGQNFTG